MPVTECYHELDKTYLLELDDHRKYQMMLGMLQCMVTIGRPEVYQVVSILDRFGSFPREGHLDLLVRCFGYIKTTINKHITIDYIPIQFNMTAPNFTKLIPDFLKDYYDSKEEMDEIFPA